MDIKGAVALIAGGGGGFGAATARRLHAAGASVVISDLDEARGKAVADELGERALFVRTDVTDEESVQAAIAATEPLEHGERGVIINPPREPDRDAATTRAINWMGSLFQVM
jgi:NAD(P)-dependent dehydrogenase (short-subunit alcohol dehydrogenase family)